MPIPVDMDFGTTTAAARSDECVIDPTKALWPVRRAPRAAGERQVGIGTAAQIERVRRAVPAREI